MESEGLEWDGLKDAKGVFMSLKRRGSMQRTGAECGQNLLIINKKQFSLFVKNTPPHTPVGSEYSDAQKALERTCLWEDY
jgi:hypothetical protein